MRYALLIPALLALTACTSDIPSPEQTAQDKAYCEGLGAKPLTDAYVNCMVSRDQNRISAVEARRARSMALTNFGTGIIAQQNAAAYTPRPTMTTCNRQGAFVNCTSF